MEQRKLIEYAKKDLKDFGLSRDHDVVYVGMGCDELVKYFDGEKRLCFLRSCAGDLTDVRYRGQDIGVHYFTPKSFWEKKTGLKLNEIYKKEMKKLPERFYILAPVEEIGVAIQKQAFKLGYSWHASGKEILSADITRVYSFSPDKKLMGWNSNITSEILLKLGVELPIKDFFDPELIKAAPLVYKKGEFLQKHEMVVADGKVTVGCENFPISEFLRVAREIKDYVNKNSFPG